MCLITTQKVALVATEEIEVAKSFILREDNRLESAMQNYIYPSLTPPKVEIRDSSEWCVAAPEDSDYLRNNGFGEDSVEWGKNPKLKCLGEGYHSVRNTYSNRKRLYYSPYEPDTYTIRVCIIPIGSEYYEDALGNIVSDQIIITDNEIPI